MALRSPRERIFQTLCFEAGGLAAAAPVYSLMVGAEAGDGFIVIAAIAVAVMIWSPLHNTLWDWVEHRRTGRVASDRPQVQRVLHALSHEVTSLVLTLPIMMILGGHDLRTALLLDLGLTLFYTGYAYVFHMIYDWARPVHPRAPQEVRP